MNPTRERQGAMALLASSVRGRRRQLTGLAAWSVVQALPAYLSGYVVAQAIDDGFLAGRPGRGLVWLGLLGASLLVGAWGTRQTYERLAAVVEPFRDHLVVIAVNGALRRSPDLAAPADTAAVARVTQHVEIVREAYASVLMVVQGFLVTVVSALLGLFTLAPVTLVLVLPPVLVGLAVFVLALRPMAVRQRASILADERIAETATTMVRGLRDVVACGAEEAVRATVAEQIDAQARATRAVATVTAFRSITVVLGGWVPVVLILVAGPWLLDRGATAGAIIGALFYVLQGVQPALQSLVAELGGSGLWLLVTLDRLAETASSPDPTASAQPAARDGRCQPEGHEVRLSGVTFRYGPSAEPVIAGLDLVIPEGDHLVVVGPSGAGKSTLAGLISGLLAAEAGEVCLGGVPSVTSTPPRWRGCGCSSPRRPMSSPAHSARTSPTSIPTSRGDPWTMRSISSGLQSWWNGSVGTTPSCGRLRCRPANASCSPWCAPTCHRPRSWCSTRPPATSILPPRRWWRWHS